MLKLSDLSELLDRLDEEPADALGSETLEFKSWDPQSQQRKTQLRSLRETVFAFVNARGGLLVLGVADRKRTRSDAIQGVGNLVADGLRRDIYDGTEPHILVEVDELQEPEGRHLVVRVPRGLPPHTTTDGVADFSFAAARFLRLLWARSTWRLFPAAAAERHIDTRAESNHE